VPRRITSSNMVYLAPARHADTPEATARTGTAAAMVNAPSQDRGEQIDLETIADKVYSLMQHDLTLELERVTRLGG
jgi:hypothetical protein